MTQKRHLPNKVWLSRELSDTLHHYISVIESTQHYRPAIILFVVYSWWSILPASLLSLLFILRFRASLVTGWDKGWVGVRTCRWVNAGLVCNWSSAWNNGRVGGECVASAWRVCGECEASALCCASTSALAHIRVKGKTSDWPFASDSNRNCWK